MSKEKTPPSTTETIELATQPDWTAEIAELKEKLAKAELEKENAIRTAAEYENSRKRAMRDVEIERKFFHTKFASDLLTGLDNLDRAVDAAKKTGDTESLVQGVAATQSQFLDILKRHGITPIEAKGQPFDPNIHEAVSMQPTPDVAPNTVVQVLQKGFTIHDRVLRPATVIISAPV
jgi:molecular chaperone GrpE